MEDLLRILVTPLVEHTDDISIRTIAKNHNLVLELKVNPDDMGRVIGKGGRRAQAIRCLMKAKANCLGEKVLVDIVD